METSAVYSIIKYKDGKIVDTTDEIVVEYGLDVYVNEKKLVRLLCTPKSIESLCIGFLKSEGLIEAYDDVEDIIVDEEKCSAYIKIRDHNGKKGFEGTVLNVVGTSKGMVSERIYNESFEFSKKAIGDIVSKIDFSKLLGTVEKFGAMSELFKGTGGVHSCAAGSFEEIEIFEEDIGRHNALDKVVGSCIIRGIDRSDKILFLSGRVSSEMLLKAIAGGFGAIVSRSAPTNAAVEIAREKGIFLCGFARGDKLNIYSGFPSIYI